jgi:glucokinase
VKLVADVGGTSTRVARVVGRTVKDVAVYKNADLGRFEDALSLYAEAHRSAVRALAIGAAGPVYNGQCSLTNLPWRIDSRSLQKRYGTVLLVNDMVAHAHGANSARTTWLRGDAAQAGARIVINPGTGFGLALLSPSGICHATEYGHTPHASRHLRGAPESGTVEDWLSGPGLVRLYRLRAKKDVSDGRAIVRAARHGTRAARIAVDLFARMLANEAQVAQLRLGASGGTVFTGNLVKAMGPAVRAAIRALPPTSMHPFRSAPIGVVLEPELALRGLARMLEDFH